MEWKEVTLGEVSSKIGDGLHGTPQYDGDGSYYFINGNNLNCGKIIIKDDTKRVGIDEFVKNQKELNEQTLLVSINGTIGNVAKYNNEPCILGKSACYINVIKEVDKEFIYYVLTSANFKRNITNEATGTTIKNVSLKQMREYKFNIPCNIADQHRIASILSSLDRKIELNNKINADLEEMAQAIFKNWFVDFEPFKDGKFVDSELGMIPEGWKVGRLDEIADVVGGSTPSKAKPEYYTQKGIAWLTPKDLSNHPAVYTSRGVIDITEEGYNSTSTKLMPKGTILFTSRAPIGYISIAQNDICTNQGFKSLVPKKAGTCFLYCFLKYVTPEIENKSTGSTFKEASRSLMKSLQVIMPEQKVFEEFEEIVSPLFARIESLEKESSRLSLLRDTLLPRLMSGELEVPE
mgnify:FL=1